MRLATVYVVRLVRLLSISGAFGCQFDQVIMYSDDPATGAICGARSKARVACTICRRQTERDGHTSLTPRASSIQTEDAVRLTLYRERSIYCSGNIPCVDRMGATTVDEDGMRRCDQHNAGNG